MDRGKPRGFAGGIRQLLLVEDTDPQRENARDHQEQERRDQRKLHQALATPRFAARQHHRDTVIWAVAGALVPLWLVTVNVTVKTVGGEPFGIVKMCVGFWPGEVTPSPKFQL